MNTIDLSVLDANPLLGIIFSLFLFFLIGFSINFGFCVFDALKARLNKRKHNGG